MLLAEGKLKMEIPVNPPLEVSNYKEEIVMTHGKIPLLLSGVLCLFLVPTKVSAEYVNPRFGSVTPAEVDPSKAADIYRLMDLTGAKQVAAQVTRNMESMSKPTFSRVLKKGRKIQ